MDREMSLERHLGELRYRIFFALAAFFAGMIGAWFLAPPILHDSIHRLGIQSLIFTQPGEAFGALLYIAVVVGLAFAAPFILYQIVAFIAPGLTRVEKRILVSALPVGALLFLVGSAFAYVFIVPFAWRFLIGFQTPELVQMVTVSKFLNFLMGLVLPVGLIFEWPLVVWALARLGILPADLLRRGRKVAYVAILIVAGAITPPAVWTQVLVAVPLIALYEVGIWLARGADRARRL